MSLRPHFQLLRPTQWAKNLFIFLPLFFHGKLLDIDLLFQCAMACIAFSFAASSIYCFNDIYDVALDRLHQSKSKRPIASGKITVSQAYIMMGICMTVAILVIFIFFRGKQLYLLLAMIICYYLMNIAYCIRLKSYAIIDVLIIAIGFVLRIYVGGQATGIWLSEWMVIMTFLLALFLAFAKRRDDVILYEKTGIRYRGNTNRYNLEFMNQILTSISTITIIAYIMYTLSPEVIARFQNHHLYLTSVFVLTGIIRYLQVTIVDSKSGSPTKILLKDRFVQLCILGWIFSFLILIYL
ncbi:MAG: UbiA prenyltransferase family protein [Pedobacter sp.]|nr:UbiA prenyltransferase family protein [Pedobacter sp.]MDQ8053933.1 UbiA prenyltransferase family protein [Pedobacter sp.]